MALGNISLSDMPWLGKPADPAESFARGMEQGQSFASRKQDAAAKQQAMSQSADMHPLKMEASKAATNLNEQTYLHREQLQPHAVTSANLRNLISRQSYDFNEATKESKISMADSLARRSAVNASVAEGTQQSQMDRYNAQTHLLQDAALISGATLQNQIDRSDINVATGWENLYHTQFENGEEMRRRQREGASRDLLYRDIGSMNSAAESDDWETIYNYVPAAELTTAQKNDANSHRLQLLRRKSAQEYMMANGFSVQAEAQSQIESLNAMKESPAGQFFREQGGEAANAGFHDQNGRINNAGHAALKRYKESEELRKVLGQEAWASVTRGGGTVPGLDAPARRFSGGDIIIPSREQIEELNKMAHDRGVAAKDRAEMIKLAPEKAKIFTDAYNAFMESGDLNSLQALGSAADVLGMAYGKSKIGVVKDGLPVDALTGKLVQPGDMVWKPVIGSDGQIESLERSIINANNSAKGAGQGASKAPSDSPPLVNQPPDKIRGNVDEFRGDIAKDLAARGTPEFLARWMLDTARNYSDDIEWGSDDSIDQLVDGVQSFAYDKRDVSLEKLGDALGEYGGDGRSNWWKNYEGGRSGVMLPSTGREVYKKLKPYMDKPATQWPKEFSTSNGTKFYRPKSYQDLKDARRSLEYFEGWDRRLQEMDIPFGTSLWPDPSLLKKERIEPGVTAPS